METILVIIICLAIFFIIKKVFFGKKSDYHRLLKAKTQSSEKVLKKLDKEIRSGKYDDARNISYKIMNRSTKEIAVLRSKDIHGLRKKLVSTIEKWDRDSERETRQELYSKSGDSSNLRPKTYTEDERSRLGPGLRFDILKRDNFSCALCGKTPTGNRNATLEIDHIVPVSKGGKTEYDNLQTLCFECNRGKGAKFV